MRKTHSIYAAAAAAAIAAIVAACMSAPQGDGSAGSNDIAGTVTGVLRDFRDFLLCGQSFASGHGTPSRE